MQCYIKLLILILVVPFCYLLDAKSAEIESETQRETYISSRARRLYKGDFTRSYVSLGGIYLSDNNSKSYQLNSRYFKQSSRKIIEFTFNHQTEYSEKFTKDKKLISSKSKELYDGSAFTKSAIKESKNYLAAYHRSIYNPLSDYKYDYRYALAIGRELLGGNLELDFGPSYHGAENYGRSVDFATSWRIRSKITDQLSLLNRGYLFIDHESIDSEIRTSFIYRLKNDFSVEVRHNFERRRYEKSNKNTKENLLNRSVTFGVIVEI